MVMTRRSDFNSYIQNNGGKVEPLIDELEAPGRPLNCACNAFRRRIPGGRRFRSTRPDRDIGRVEGERHG